jgi:glycerate dehydrogenase
MKIVVLDGFTLNPGDLNWDDLQRMGELTVYDRTSADEVVERCREANIVLTNKTSLPGDLINQLPNLQFVSVLATGYNIVDIAAADARGIVVSNVPGYGTASVVQLTFALMLQHFNQVGLHSDAVKQGEWSRSKDFTFSKSPLTELNNKTIGIIGFGTIGKQVSEVAAAFGMHILAYSRTKTDQRHRKNFRWAEQDDLYAASDIISLHCPLTEATRGIINRQTLEKMKSTALLVNTSRGPLIVEEDLARALNNDVIGGAALDVLSQEPPPATNPLLSAKNCIITPHIAWATKEARARLMRATVENITAWLAGSPINVVK